MNVIAEITDETFGLKSEPFNNPKVRFWARGIVKKDDGGVQCFLV